MMLVHLNRNAVSIETAKVFAINVVKYRVMLLLKQTSLKSPSRYINNLKTIPQPRKTNMGKYFFSPINS